MKIGIIQQSNCDNVEQNKQKLADNIRKVAAEGAELVVLQELHNSLYFCQVESTQNFSLAEPIPGPSTEFYSAIAAECKVVLVTSLFEARAKGLYHNTAVVFDKDGSIAGKYRKMHIPDDPAYYEKFYFTPGDIGFRPIRTSIGTLGVQVCWDQWYPEGARLMALRGADLLIYPTAIGWESSDTKEEQGLEKDPDRRAWEKVARLMENVPKPAPVHQKIVAGIVGVHAAAMLFQSFRKEDVTPAELLANFKAVKKELDKYELHQFSLLNDALARFFETGKAESLETATTADNLKAYHDYLHKGNREAYAHFVSLIDGTNYKKMLVFINKEMPTTYKKVLQFISTL